MPRVLEDFGLSKFDYEQIKSIFSSIDVLDEERMRSNISLLITYGYPYDDLSIILIINPSVLSYSPERLEKKLQILTEGKKFNLENILKCDPFIL